MSEIIPATAGILIGGKSQRFGSPKWRAEIGGVTVLDRLWEACGDFEEKVVIGKAKPPDLDKPFLEDELPEQAPIVGLHTLLKNSHHDWNLLLSCDLPLLTSEALGRLWEAKDHKFDAIMPEAGSRLQVTCALYHTRLEKTVHEVIESSSLSLMDLIHVVTSRKVSFEQEAKAFMNMNTPEDFERITELEIGKSRCR